MVGRLMADDQDDKSDRSDWEQVHEEALLEYDRDYAREKGNIDEAYEDLRFRRGKLEDQWTPEALAVRAGRPWRSRVSAPESGRTTGVEKACTGVAPS